MKKIISFSLWGDDKSHYVIGAIRNAELCEKIFPGWKCRFYIDKNMCNNIKEELLKLNAEVIEKEITHVFAPYLWRFLAVDSDIMISRDCDSRISIREKIAVDEWLKSDKNFHIIRDHPHHNFLILAGMWGVRNNLLSNIEELIKKWVHVNKKQNDQIFLANIVYPLIKDDVYIHDEFIRFETNKHKINHDRNNYEFIGQYVDANEKISEFHRMELKKIIG